MRESEVVGSAPEFAGLGHNSAAILMTVEIRLFNRIFQRFGNGVICNTVEVPVGTNVGAVLASFQIPESEVFIAFVNGRDITNSAGTLNTDRQLEDGDTVALSGPVPYSWGYGAPVV